MCNVQPGYERLVSVYAQQILWLSCDDTKYSCKYNIVCCYLLVSFTVVFVSFCWGGALRDKTREITPGTPILQWANEKWHTYQLKTSHSKKALPCHLYHCHLTTGRTLVYIHVLFVSLHVPSTSNACSYTSTMWIHVVFLSKALIITLESPR